MNNKDLLLERILLNMKYDSKKTLSENKKIILSKPVLLEYEGQEIPTTMNQIMQFQEWVWRNVDKLGNPNNADKNKTYTTKLCSQPCTPYNRRINGKIYSGAIDGIYGGNTLKLWNTYKETYKKSNPKWDEDDVATSAKVTGISSPQTMVAIKNFQKWYLEQKEKAVKNSKNLYTTKLCITPCTYSTAVDGNWGDNTKAVWKTYGSEYQKANTKWMESVEWSVESQNAENLLKERVDLAGIFKWSMLNPSGWNGTTTVPDAIDEKISTTYAKQQRSQAEAIFFNGWNLLNNIFPAPRKYTEQELKRLFNATGGDTEYQAKLSEKNKSDQEFYEKNMGRTNTGNVVKSDRLGYDRYVADPSGIGDTQYGKDSKKHMDYWNSELEKAKNHIYEEAKKWNKNYDDVVSTLKEKCGSPLSFCDSQNNSNCVYVSYSDVCRKAGGIWVWNAGKNDAWCGCRSMNAQDLKKEFSAQNMFQFNGPQGPFVKTIEFSHSLEYQTPFSGIRDRKEREEEHHNMMLLEFGLMGLGFITGPLGPLFFGAAAIVGVADGIKYYAEGDKHMGVMMISLSLLGIPEIAAAFRVVKNGVAAAKIVGELGEAGIKRLAKDALDPNIVLSATQKANLKVIKESVYYSQKILGKEISKKVAQNFVTNLPTIAKQNGWGMKEFAKIFWNFAEKQPSLKGMLIYVGGIPYTIDQIYLALYGNDLDRQRSGLGMLFDYLSGSPSATKNVVDQAFSTFIAKIQGDAEMQKQVNELMKKIEKLDPSGGSGYSVNSLIPDDVVIEKFRKMGMVTAKTGFEQEKFDELMKQQAEKLKELQEKEGCDKLSLLQKPERGLINWEEIPKIDYTKLMLNNPNGVKLETTKCGGKDYYFSELKLGELPMLKPTEIQTNTSKEILQLEPKTNKEKKGFFGNMFKK
jgi:hypothetical protein